jgi:hypothetical protein
LENAGGSGVDLRHAQSGRPICFVIVRLSIGENVGGNARFRSYKNRKRSYAHPFAQKWQAENISPFARSKPGRILLHNIDGMVDSFAL